MAYEACTTSDRGELSHRPMHDIQLPHAVLSCYPGLQNKNLNNLPHWSCSGPRKMKQVWIWYPTVLWRLYDAYAMSNRGGSSHIPLYDLKLHPCAASVTHCLEVLLLVFVDWLWCGLWYQFGLLDSWYWRLLCIVLEESSNGVKLSLRFN